MSPCIVSVQRYSGTAGSTVWFRLELILCGTNIQSQVMSLVYLVSGDIDLLSVDILEQQVTRVEW
jgi:hypothetical protein